MDLVEQLRIDPEHGARRLEVEYKAGLLALARRLCADEGDAEVPENIDDVGTWLSGGTQNVTWWKDAEKPMLVLIK